MSASLWTRTVRAIPRLSPEEWRRLGVFSKWLVASRAAVLIMTLISSSIGGILAFRDGGADAGLFFLTVLGLVLAHATNNLINDFTDHLTGADKGDSLRAQYGPHPLEHGLMTRRELLGYAGATGALALAIGGYLVWARGAPVLWLLLAGAFFVLFYTYPLKYIGLGELAVLAVWGPLMVGGTYLTTTGRWDWTAALAGMPYALAAATVIFGKHIDKLAMDEARRVRTLPVLIGERAARWTAIVLLLAMYAVLGALIARGYFHPVLLVVGFAVPSLVRAIQAYRRPRPATRPSWYRADVWPLWFVAIAFWHARRFGLLLLGGMLLDWLLVQAGAGH
jgi:1,4-dihydroxy-2-naphthoate octaprenyltransferase